MTWNCYLTIFKAEAPVHIGYKQIGILKTTRYYITGRAMWGAITANLTREGFDSPCSDTYQGVGNDVKKYIRTTYFYPSIIITKERKKAKAIIYLPKNTKFEQLFVGSLVSTSIDPLSKSAEEGSLHEIEFINNKVKIKGKFLDVYWIGYLFIKKLSENSTKKEYIVNIICKDDDVEIEFNNGKKLSLKDTIKIIYVGGEKNYGLGKLRLLLMKKQIKKIFKKFEIELNKENPIIKNLDFAISHIEIDEKLEEKISNENINIIGEIEPLVGLEWSNKKGAGQKISEPKICIAPGSIFLNNNFNFEIKEYGILKFFDK